MQLRSPVLIAFLAGIGAAHAQPPGGVAVDAGERITVSSDVCAALADLPPGGDAAYVAGRDVYGHRVAPADLPDSSQLSFDEFAIEITVDLKRRFGIPADARLFQGEAKLGYVVIDGGRAYFNGQELSTGEQSLLASACRRHAR
jgi:hypothetical protein